MIFVDSNVLIDVTTDGPHGGEWSKRAMDHAKATDELCASDIVYAELAYGYKAFEELDAALEPMRIKIVPAPRAALFLAGHAYKHYRERGGTKAGVLPDFLIGAHAAVEGAMLLTRDPQRVRSYFPTVALITP